MTRELIRPLAGPARAELGTSEFQVMPRAAIARGLDGPMRAPGDPGATDGSRTREGQESGRLHPDPKVSACSRCGMPGLRSQALTPEDSLGLLTRMRGAAMSTPDLAWFKSSYSSAPGDDCVEVATCPEASTYGTPRTSRPPNSPSPPPLDRLRRLRRPGLTFTPRAGSVRRGALHIHRAGGVRCPLATAS